MSISPIAIDPTTSYLSFAIGMLTIHSYRYAYGPSYSPMKRFVGDIRRRNLCGVTVCPAIYARPLFALHAATRLPAPVSDVVGAMCTLSNARGPLFSPFFANAHLPISICGPPSAIVHLSMPISHCAFDNLHLPLLSCRYPFSITLLPPPVCQHLFVVVSCVSPFATTHWSVFGRRCPFASTS